MICISREICSDDICSLDQIERSSTLIIYLSFCTLPDFYYHASHLETYHQLCVEGISKLLLSFAPGFRRCSIVYRIRNQAQVASRFHSTFEELFSRIDLLYTPICK